MTCSRCGSPRDRPGQRYCRACHNAYQRAWRAPYWALSEDEKRQSNARAYANTYQRRGRLRAPEACEWCGTPSFAGPQGRLQKHHSDYSKPLDVKWLHPECHRALHREEKKWQTTG